MRGILSWGAYLPYRRLDRSQIAAFVGQGGGKGTRTVASYDEDAATLAVEASRLALKATESRPETLLFATASPPYADKTSATTVHAALRLDPTVTALDLGASTRSAVGGLRLALQGSGTALVAAGDLRTGLAGSADEAAGGDAGAALVVGDGDAVVAEYLGGGSATAEFLDRWRVPGDVRSRVWDDKFSEVTYGGLARDAWASALTAAGVEADRVTVAVAAPTARIGKSVAGKLGAAGVVGDLTDTVGATGAAQPALLLAALLEQAQPGQALALVTVGDGVEVLVFLATDTLASHQVGRPIATQLEAGAPLAYGRFLSWRGMLKVEPPRRPEPARPSGTAAARSSDWKYGFVASRDTESGTVFLPPSRVSFDGERTDQMEQVPMADVQGTIATFTVDRMAYSPSPPVIFAVVDFDGGGRLPIELTDTDLEEVEIGKRIEMTFRRLFTADGIHNYFWKGRLVRG
ncbi:OB-fold domain-containing protein [Rhabdothermincola salaria]|uniref:OB-fold domain-containing protein n=1 Tax=Rhabdothermincola salaria TaxID=2903142 RepID=UPI001E592C9F|nr:OB-fold domain-containing protein [Rhabdothermincola salaria]MCD9622278.1 OB-fold domain-containing protein [Rhabdothermincola salaria]